MKDERQLEAFIKEYEPMIKGVKRRLIQKWFALEPQEIESLVNLTIFKLWRKNKKDDFILTKKVLQLTSERAVIKQILRAPNVEVKLVKDEQGRVKKKVNVHQTAYLDQEVDDGLCLMDTIPDDSPTVLDTICENEELEEQKALVLTVISERTWKQLCFEYENKCVSQSNLNLIQKIKRMVNKNELD